MASNLPVLGWLFGAAALLSPVSAFAENPSAPDNGVGPAGNSGDGPRASEPVAAGAAPPAPSVVAPVLEHYEPPVYPEGAAAEGLEAEVALQITVEADGTVSEAVVPEPVGHGFDEAAIAAARKLTFQPALVAGKARKVKIGFRYSFHMEAKPAPPPAAPTVGNLGGRVVLSVQDRPVAGLTISVVDALGQKYSSRTDEEGYWLLEGLPPGQYQVSIAREGFDAVAEKEDVIAGEATQVTYRLMPQAAKDEIIVRGERPPREVTKRTLQRRELERIPGTSGDALRAIQSLPGVARPPGLAGLLIVRGSAPQDTATFVDGTSVPLIYHFGGLSSVIPTELLEKIDFYPGNFSVRYGRQMGGIVNAGIRSPDTECRGPYAAPTDRKGCFHGLIQADLIDARVLLQGPLGKDWSFALAGRRSYIDTWLKPVLESAGSAVTSAPVYYDYQAIVDRDLGPGDKLSFRFYGSDDAFKTIITNPSASEPGLGGSLRYSTSFVRGQVLYRKDLTKRLSLDTQFSVGVDTIDFGLGGNLKFNLRTIPIYYRSELQFQVNPTTRVNMGIDFLASIYDVNVRAPAPSRSGEASPGPFVTRPPRESASNGTNFRPGWYADMEWQPSKRLRVVPGIRVDYSGDTGQTDVSPRANFRYSLFLPEDEAFFGQPRKTVFKGGLGKFAQPPQFQETDPTFGTPGISSNNSYHYSLGLEQGITSQVELSVEGFYKDIKDWVARSGFGYANEGSGEVIGLETLLKYNPDDRFFGWFSYTISQSKRQNCPTCEEYLFQYDQTHNFIILGSYRLGNGWEFGARFRVISGNLETPTVASPALPSIYSGDAGTYVAIDGAPYSVRLPMFHQLDVRVDKRFQFRDWRLNAYVDIQNVYNNAAAEAYVFNYNYSQYAYQTGLPILPSLGLRGEF